MSIPSDTIENLKKKIELIDKIIDRVVISDYKMKLLLLRGDAYKDLFEAYRKSTSEKPQQREEGEPKPSESHLKLKMFEDYPSFNALLETLSWR